MSALVIAEHNNKQLADVTLAVVSGALTLQTEIDILVIGYHCKAVAEQASKLQGIRKVISIDHEVYEHHLAENLAQVIKQLSQDYSHLLAPSSTFGKDLMPRVAALLDVMQISDVIRIVDASIYVRPIYAGNALLTVQSKDAMQVITIRSSAYPPVGIGHSVSIEERDIAIPLIGVAFRKQEVRQSERSELTSAKIVVSGGRGLQKPEHFHLIERLADQLGAAVGATRAVVDAGFVANDLQVGQTGKVVAPLLYIAIGISGAIQHLAGMKDSKVIVAINKDPEAPIFQVADYGLVADLFTVLPELEKELEKLGYPPQLNVA